MKPKQTRSAPEPEQKPSAPPPRVPLATTMEPWGMSAVLYKSPRLQLRLLTIRKGMSLGLRRHAKCSKSFLVSDGHVIVTREPDSGFDMIEVAINSDGTPDTVLPGLWYNVACSADKDHSEAIVYEVTMAIGETAVDPQDVELPAQQAE